MSPSIWSVMVIFIGAPLAIVAMVTGAVVLLASPVRRPVVISPAEAAEAAEEDGQVDRRDEHDA